MRSVFCVISAIGNDYGIFSYQDRLEQLKGTIRSVRERVSDADIVLVDASEDPLPRQDVIELSSMVNAVMLLNDDLYIDFLKHNSKDPSPNKFEKKSVGEMRAMSAFLRYLQESPKVYDRVFKISGRYRLSDSFSLDSYADKAGKCVFLDKEDWYGEHVFTLRLWSFDYSDLNRMGELFERMQRHTYTLVAQTHLFEIVEFTFTKFIETMQIPYVTTDRIGVCGLMGLGGEPIDQ